jgi:hypothetical protein
VLSGLRLPDLGDVPGRVTSTVGRREDWRDFEMGKEEVREGGWLLI